jgi:hypothetical protein
MTKQLAKSIGQTMIMIHSLLLGPAMLAFSLTLNFLSILFAETTRQKIT